METITALLKTGRLSQLATYLLLFLFSLGVDASFGYCLRVIYPFTMFFIFLLLLRFVRPLYVIATIFFMLFSTLYFPIGMLFESPVYGIIVSAAYTNPEEVVGFLASVPTRYYIGSFFIFMLGISCCRCRLTCSFKNKQVIFIVTFILVAICYKPLKQFMINGNFKIIDTEFTPIRFLRDAFIAGNSVYNEHKKIKECLKIEDDWKVLSATTKYQNYILVIGESERKDLRHNYGFSVKNTPFASAANGLFFENYLSAGPSTVLSLTNTLAKRHLGVLQLHNNIIALAKRAGFYTYWISNQYDVGQYETPTSIIGKCADSSLFIKTLNSVKFRNANDNELVPFIKSALTDTTIIKPKLIVVHLMGSHPPCKKRTNGQFDVYFNSKNISCYIQSIRNTDRFLENLTEVARSTGESWSMLYFSDHGLALEKGFFGHSDKYQESYRVPMFILSYDDEKQDRITAYRSAIHFPILFSQWTGIQENSLKSDCNYLYNTQCNDQTSIILGNKNMTDIGLLATNPIKN